MAWPGQAQCPGRRDESVRFLYSVSKMKAECEGHFSKSLRCLYFNSEKCFTDFCETRLASWLQPLLLAHCNIMRTLNKSYLKILLALTLDNDQLDAQTFNTFITILYMYMFRAISCSFSGGHIVLIQHLVSSLSVSDRRVHLCTGRSLTESDDTRCCINTIWSPKNEQDFARNIYM
jgi:hypothetical protein